MSDAARKILIVDDDHRNIFALSATLKARGYKCITATDAFTALSILQSGERIDAMLLDMMMPDMDGYETLKRVRSDNSISSTPVIAVTAQAMTGDREKCLQAGADNYLSKPVDVDRLLGMLEHICDDHRH
jgi:two-component system, cell cycle response regulator DivK